MVGNETGMGRSCWPGRPCQRFGFALSVTEAFRELFIREVAHSHLPSDKVGWDAIWRVDCRGRSGIRGPVGRLSLGSRRRRRWLR